jgi:hypothetical protein
MESSISHEQRVIRTNRNVFWNEQLTSHVLSNDDNNIQRTAARWILVNYMDDFAIPGETKQQLQERTVRFLKIADKHNLYFKRSKCDFDVTQISMLGTVIGDGKATMEKDKVEAIRNWETPMTIKEVEKFLGFANFYQQFIKNFSMIAAPLNALKGGKGEKVWKWETEEQKAFKSIKEAITTKPVLTLPNEEGTFHIEVNASNIGTGAVLSQEQQGKWHPVAFMSKSLLDAKKNYGIYDKELLAIVKALKVWRHYLVHAKKQFEIWTDHENLKYFRKPQKLNA